jgi:hypothetical protein
VRPRFAKQERAVPEASDDHGGNGGEQDGLVVDATHRGFLVAPAASEDPAQTEDRHGNVSSSRSMVGLLDPVTRAERPFLQRLSPA